MAIGNYFSKKYGSSVLPGQGDYSKALSSYGSADLWRPSIGSLDLGTPVITGNGFGGGSVTGSVDGAAPAADWLKGLAGAVLSNMGAQAEPQMQATPVAYSTGGGDGGFDWRILAVAAVGVGVVIYAAQS